ncbi:MAG TPA: SRPBCC domain-containing protein [Nitrososphaerales archaeon]|nr:SRPBCC domain-containing protein [Nitrososphaerales archaeon]
MEIHETAILDASVSKIWAALNDPNVLKLCVPGCQEIRVIDPNTYSAKAVIKVGFISSKFNDIKVKKTQSLENQMLSFEMSGEDVNKIGSFKQELEVRLSELNTDPQPKTNVEIKASVDLKGKFATLGKRIVEWKAKQVTGEFVDNLRNVTK